jgi:hypothetical protein
MMKDASASIAMTLAFPGVLFGLLPASQSHWKAALIVFGVSAALFVSASLALGSASLWFLRAALIATLIAFLASDAPFGLMDGGIITIPIFFVLVMGVITSLCARRKAL